MRIGRIHPAITGFPKHIQLGHPLWLQLKKTWEVFPCPYVVGLRDSVSFLAASTDGTGATTAWRSPSDSVVSAVVAELSAQLRQQRLRHFLRALEGEILTCSRELQKVVLKLMLLRQWNLSSGLVMHLEPGWKAIGGLKFSLLHLFCQSGALTLRT